VTQGKALFSASDNVERVESSVVFDTLWVVGGAEDTILALPSLPRPDGAGGLVFFDLTNVKAYRIGANGDLLWSWGEKGEGPGEIMNVRALDVRSDGSVVLVDSGNQRLVTLDANGQLVGEVPFRWAIRGLSSPWLRFPAASSPCMRLAGSGDSGTPGTSSMWRFRQIWENPRSFIITGGEQGGRADTGFSVLALAMDGWRSTAHGC